MRRGLEYTIHDRELKETRKKLDDVSFVYLVHFYIIISSISCSTPEGEGSLGSVNFPGKIIDSPEKGPL